MNLTIQKHKMKSGGDYFANDRNRLLACYEVIFKDISKAV